MSRKPCAQLSVKWREEKKTLNIAQKAHTHKSGEMERVRGEKEIGWEEEEEKVVEEERQKCVSRSTNGL